MSFTTQFYNCAIHMFYNYWPTYLKKKYQHIELKGNYNKLSSSISNAPLKKKLQEAEIIGSALPRVSNSWRVHVCVYLRKGNRN